MFRKKDMFCSGWITEVATIAVHGFPHFHDVLCEGKVFCICLHLG